MDRTKCLKGRCWTGKPSMGGIYAGLSNLPILVAAMAILMCMGSVFNPSSSYAGEIYRWVDDKGEVHYSDAAPPEASSTDHKVKSIHVPESPVTGEAKETPQPVKKKDAPVKVSAQKDITIYTRDT